MTRHASGLYVLPHPQAIEEVAKIDPETLQRLLGLLKAAFGTVVIDTSKGLQSSDFVGAGDLRRDPRRRPARPDLPAEHRPADRAASSSSTAWPIGSSWSSTAPARATPRSQPAKAEETLKMPISWQIPNATKIFQAARIKGVADRRRRQGEPAAPGVPRDGPCAAASDRGAPPSRAEACSPPSSESGGDRAHAAIVTYDSVSDKPRNRDPAPGT